jgi:hypothetical protein
MSRRERSVYTTGETIRWVVDDDRVIVVDDAGPAAFVLQGQEALIWRLVTLTQRYRKLVEFLSGAADIIEPEAERQLRAALERWTRLGVCSCATEVGSD